MAMNVNPIPPVDERINDIRMRTAGIVKGAALAAPLAPVHKVLIATNVLGAYRAGSNLDFGS